MKNKILNKLILIILTAFFAFFAKNIKADGASLFFEPLSGSFLAKDVIFAKLKINTNEFSINAAEAVVEIISEEVEILEVSKENSIFSIWPEEPNFDENKINFSGGLPSPGFKGEGEILNIKFRINKPGTANLSFKEGKILANDGKGTDVLMFLKEAKYYIQEKNILDAEKPEELTNIKVFSPTHPNQQEWYSNKSPVFQWKINSKVKKINYALDKNTESPSVFENQNLVESVKYENLEDGVWYFHIRFGDEKNWSEKINYKISIDSSPPTSFDVVVKNLGDPANPNLNLYFETTDNISGIEYYKIKVGEDDFLKLMMAEINPFSLPNLLPGVYPIVVRATDKAGNNVESKTTISVDSIKIPEISLFPEKYLAGEDVFYMEGSSLPNVGVIIFLEKDGKEIRKWLVSSDDKGFWFFSTKELIKSGTYNLKIQAKDKRGTLSSLSEPKELEVTLSGFNFGPLLLSLKTVILLLIILILLGISVIVFFMLKNKKTKKKLKKETFEAKKILSERFQELKKEIEKKIGMFDLQPGLSEKEKILYEDLKKSLEKSENSIKKEVEDIEKELE
jgi:hypothetical protein